MAIRKPHIAIVIPVVCFLLVAANAGGLLLCQDADASGGIECAFARCCSAAATSRIGLAPKARVAQACGCHDTPITLGVDEESDGAAQSSGPKITLFASPLAVPGYLWSFWNFAPGSSWAGNRAVPARQSNPDLTVIVLLC